MAITAFIISYFMVVNLFICLRYCKGIGIHMFMLNYFDGLVLPLPFDEYNCYFLSFFNTRFVQWISCLFVSKRLLVTWNSHHAYKPDHRHLSRIHYRELAKLSYPALPCHSAAEGCYIVHHKILRIRPHSTMIIAFRFILEILRMFMNNTSL